MDYDDFEIDDLIDMNATHIVPKWKDDEYAILRSYYESDNLILQFDELLSWLPKVTAPIQLRVVDRIIDLDVKAIEPLRNYLMLNDHKLLPYILIELLPHVSNEVLVAFKTEFERMVNDNICRDLAQKLLSKI